MKVDEPDASPEAADEAADGSLSVVDRPIAPPPGDPFEEPAAADDDVDSSDEASESEPESSAKTATAIRKGDGPARMRRIETRWVPQQESPNVWFIVVSVLFFLAAFGIFLLSMYLR